MSFRLPMSDSIWMGGVDSLSEHLTIVILLAELPFSLEWNPGKRD